MSILYDSKNQLFHLQAKDTSYVLQVVKGGRLAHLYWGKRLERAAPEHLLRFAWRASFCPNPDPGDGAFSLDTLPQEYPAYGNSDFRSPAFHVQMTNGSTVSDMKYQSHQIMKGKPHLDGLPSTYTESEKEAETLEIEMMDALSGLRVVLSFSVYEGGNAITRSVRFRNGGKADVKLLRVMSMSVDFQDDEFDLMHLYGSWARERYVERKPLINGMQSIDSKRGASSHQHNPFIALLRKNADENHGEVYGFSFVYSGNFLAMVEVDQFSTARVAMGLNPFDFSWLLEPGQSFQAPEVVMVYSDEGLGGMSRTYHRLYRTRLCRGHFRDQERPILVNNWEATYFDFNSEKIMKLGKAAGDLGIELFVLDDGWFGKRDSDDSSLGDWFVDTRKLPEGLNFLAQEMNRMGMKFGLWFEPEMISPDSALYRKHPDWCLHVPGRDRTQARKQLVLDFSREDVCDAVSTMMTDILESAPIAYVKWDMNRNMTEIGSAKLPPERQRETAHRYMLGLYKTLEKITSRFPQVLFESCSGGGGRFDPGMLYYMPQTWTSDDTDAVERLKIQYGTSMVYPASTMGAHVSAVPNHQVSRRTPFETRAAVAMSGAFGYELDLGGIDEDEKELVRKQTAFYKEVRHIVQFGDYYRLISPFESQEAAWMFVTEDKSEALVVYVRVLASPQPPLKRLRLNGLKADGNYLDCNSGEAFRGDELLYSGLHLPELKGDFQAAVWRFRLDSDHG